MDGVGRNTVERLSVKGAPSSITQLSETDNVVSRTDGASTNILDNITRIVAWSIIDQSSVKALHVMQLKGLGLMEGISPLNISILASHCAI